jgi:hypothetical protein
MDDQASILAQATGLTVEQARSILQAQEALLSRAKLREIWRNEVTGDTAVRTLSASQGLPVWAIISTTSPWSIEHLPPDLPGNGWVLVFSPPN